MSSQAFERGITTPKVEEYIYSLLRPRDKVLRDLELDAQERDVPIVGPLVGSLLFIIARACKAKSILEVGTATGYSGIWFARAIEENGGKKLVTIEKDPDTKKRAEQNFRRAGLQEIVEILEGDAKTIVPCIAKKQAGRFDVVFLDVGEKTLYLDLLRPCVDLVKEGGFLIADNVLWQGLVADPTDTSERTETIRKFNSKVSGMSELQSVIVPLRDGVMVAQKKPKKKA